MMQKNDVVEIEITGTATDGSGIGRADGTVVFVPAAAEGDLLRVRIVKVLKNRAYGKMEEILRSGGSRVQPDCPAFPQCGGCVFRHISYASECEIKERRVYDALTRIGGLTVERQPLLAAGGRDAYRNKAQYPVAADKDGHFVTGFYAPHSHRVVPCMQCRLQPKEFETALGIVKNWVTNHHVSIYSEEKGTGLLRHVYFRKGFATGEMMAVLVINGKELPAAQELINALKTAFGANLKSVQVNINRERTNVVLGKKCKVLYGTEWIEDVLCGVRVRISPLSFYQVNRDMAEKLYQKAAEYAEPAGKTVLDLYCGAGTIGLSMAHAAKRVIGVELVPEAVEDARRNAALNHMDNAEFLCGDAADGARLLRGRGETADVVILDPPRKGCSAELLETVATDFVPERIVYVSCDPATLARDMKILTEKGYRLMQYTPVDLFPGTGHVETVVLITRNI